jgi:hypothetical protein
MDIKLCEDKDLGQRGFHIFSINISIEFSFNQWIKLEKQ